MNFLQEEVRETQSSARAKNTKRGTTEDLSAEESL